MTKILPQSFYNRSVLKIAQDLLGCFLVRRTGNNIRRYRIVETEGYNGPKDLASHASKGRTARNEVMFGPAGLIYVYFTYGMHYMLNIVTGPVDYPAAVLIRAVEPVRGNEAARTDGPARLTKALKIDKTFYGLPIYTKRGGLWVESRDQEIKRCAIISSSRVGVDYAGSYKNKPWRYYLKNNGFVSRK